MADMTVEEAMETYGPSELTRDDLLVLEDPQYTAENVAIVTGPAPVSDRPLRWPSPQTT